MTTRITTKTVVFARPFVLDEGQGEQPPGIYTVETEEPLDVMTISAYRRISTVMTRYDVLGSSGVMRFVTINPAELEAALARDAEPE